MCGIVGLFCKSPELEPRLGEYLSAMLVQMNDRGQAVGIGRIPSEGATTPYGFLWKDGVFTHVSFPGACGTGLDGINEQGDVCGFTTDEAGGLTHAMMRVHGVFSQGGHFLNLFGGGDAAEISS